MQPATQAATSVNVDPSSIPEKLSDADARKILDRVAPRARKISEDIVRNNARAEQGQQQMASLLAKAREHFGTEDPEQMRRILDERMAQNAQNVRAFIERLNDTETKLVAITQSAPMR